eukprot:g7306.t1
MLTKSASLILGFTQMGIPKSAAIHLLIACQTCSTWGVRVLLRIGEIFLSGHKLIYSVLRNAHIREGVIDGINFICLLLDGSKVYPFRRGCEVLLGQQDDERVCPMFWKHMYEKSCKVHRIPQGSLEAVFRSAGGRAIDLTSFVSTMRKLLCDSGTKEGAKLNCISLRRGGASVMARAGLSPMSIKRAGRWTSDCFQLYVGAPATGLLAEQRLMGLIVP